MKQLLSGGSSSKKTKTSEATTTSSSLFSSGGGGGGGSGTLKSDKLRRQHTPVDEPPRSRLQSESRMEASMFVEPQVRANVT